MPYHRQQPILLDEGALQNALRKKGSLRGGDGSVDQNFEPGANNNSRSPIRRTTYLLEPHSTRKRALGSGMILLDENRLEQALKAKAERRKAAEDSTERRRQALSSLDRVLDSPVEDQSLRAKPSKQPLKRKTLPILRLTKPVRAPRSDVHVESGSVSTSVQGDASNRSSDKMVVKKKKIVRVVKKKRPGNMVTRAEIGSSSSIVSESAASAQSSTRGPLPSNAAHQTNKPPRPTRKVKRQSSDRGQKQSASKTFPPVKIRKSTTPASVIQVVSTNKSSEQSKIRKPPSKRSIATASTAKRSGDSVSTLEDPSELVNLSDHSRLEPTSFRSQPSSFRKQQQERSSATSRSKPKTSFNLNNLPKGSDHSQEPTSSHSRPGSYRKQQPPSWSVRNEDKTGFTPNQYITKETMTRYTENLGGVETVATTTKIFFDKAKYDPELKGFFTSTKWEHVRNEFIILANLEVPEHFDENIKAVLEHHCKLLENGANIDKLVAIWESAIEASWLEHRMDDARQLIVGPSRVIFNLKALERHYAMHQKGLRAAARDSRRKEKSSGSGGGLFGRFRRGK